MTKTPTRLEQPTDFDEIAGIYDAVFPEHVVAHYLGRRSGYITRHAPRGLALDVGAGTGVLAERLHDLGYAVVALDPFPEMLAQLRRRRPGMRMVVAQGEAIPLPDDACDLTYSVAVLHHIAAPERVRRTLSEMVRVTRPGGKILIWDHNPRNPYWPLVMARVPQDSGAERLMPLAEIVRGLTAAGATIVRAEQLGLVPEFTPRRLLGLARATERVAESLPGLRCYCAHNVVLATKP